MSAAAESPADARETLEIRKVVYPGRSLGYLGGKACFTDEGLPGETVEVERLKEKPDLIEARTIRVLTAAAGRVPPLCGHYAACSPYQIADYALQLEIKAGQLREIAAAAGIRPEGAIEMTPSPRIWEYRNRVRFRVLWRGGRAVPAYNAPGRQDRFVPAEDCRLLREEVRDTAAAALAAAGRLKGALDEIEVKASGATGAVLVVLRGKTPPKPADTDPLLAALLPIPGLSGVVSLVERRGHLEERVLWGDRYLEEELGGAALRIGPRSFFQVNASIMPAVLGEMRAALAAGRAKSLADLYCGVGAFGLALRDEVEAVYGVEAEPESVALLQANAAAASGGARVTICDGTAEEWLPWVLDRGVGAIVVDPPRKGLDPSILTGLAARPVETLIYLSCNPTTLARDLKGLAGAYRLESLRGYDFFPHTPHIESLAILSGVRS